MGEKSIVTSFILKIVAIAAMTIDHAAVILGQMGIMALLHLTEMTPENLAVTANILQAMRGIGRIAFPLFAFMITEGAAKTRSMPKYIGRLTLFAVISEPFFYFAHWQNSPTTSGFLQNIIGLNFQNVFFTLVLGAIAIYACQLLEYRKVKHARLLFLSICLAAALMGGYIGCDYGAAGILLIGFLFLAQTKPQKCIVVLIWTLCLYGFGQAYNPIDRVLTDCLFAAFSCVFIRSYNGKRGKHIKWSFYIFYPAHLLILSLLGAAIR